MLKSLWRDLKRVWNEPSWFILTILLSFLLLVVFLLLRG